jgi:hypothetical protein
MGNRYKVDFPFDQKFLKKIYYKGVYMRSTWHLAKISKKNLLGKGHI